jgi:hypothetical protein
MGKTEGKKEYFSFVLRLWRAGNDEEPVWRASLKNALTQELLGFAGLKEMCAYLEAQIKEANLSSKESPDEPRLILENPREEKER